METKFYRFKFESITLNANSCSEKTKEEKNEFSEDRYDTDEEKEVTSQDNEKKTSKGSERSEAKDMEENGVSNNVVDILKINDFLYVNEDCSIDDIKAIIDCNSDNVEGDNLSYTGRNGL